MRTRNYRKGFFLKDFLSKKNFPELRFGLEGGGVSVVLYPDFEKIEKHPEKNKPLRVTPHAR